MMSKDASIGWMYEGTKGSVHREDCLLGKVQTNLEKYSDVVNAPKSEAIDTIVGTRVVCNSIQSTGLKTSLQKDIIKSEDPFVAVKVREETKRREIMDNPLMKLRLQTMLKSMMTSKSEKTKEKSKKDKKKKKKKKRSRSSSSSSRNGKIQNKETRRSPSSSRKRKITVENQQHTSIRRRDSSVERRTYDSNIRSKSKSTELSYTRSSRSPRRRRSRSRSAGKRESSSSRKRYSSRSRCGDRISREFEYSKRKRSSSASRSGRSPNGVKNESREERRYTSSPYHSLDEQSSSCKKEKRTFDSHIPHHLQKGDFSGSDTESKHDEETRKRRRPSNDNSEDSKRKSYGLVEMRKKHGDEVGENSNRPTKEYKLIKLPTGRGENSNKAREPRRVLTEEEKAARLAEMQNNAKWRDEIREKNVSKGRKEDEEEEREADKNGYAPSFIRSQMREACDGMTVEKRLQSNKRNIQRTHGYMDRSFARK